MKETYPAWMKIGQRLAIIPLPGEGGFNINHPVTVTVQSIRYLSLR